MEQETHSINVTIAGRIYTFNNFTPEQESKMRIAAEMIMSKFDEFKGRFKYADDQDFLANIALQFALRVVNEEKNAANHEFMSALQELSDQLKGYTSAEDAEI